MIAIGLHPMFIDIAHSGQNVVSVLCCQRIKIKKSKINKP
jgi:hypothetical protein